ncbi:autotransporter outer membrane beta-barrel domain-containing protein [Ochrobactrum pseudogrignonense]|nr:autotransporter outer membrane beta-barrel domain-containing protein [Brucella pseudogrignonensis]
MDRLWCQCKIGFRVCASEYYKGRATTASIEAGYGFDLGNNVVLQPQAQLIYSKIKADSFTDTYGIHVYDQSAKSLIGRVGVRLEKTIYFGDEEEVSSLRQAR